MRTVFVLLGILSLTSHTYGLTCYSCTDKNYDGESNRVGNCFKVISSGSDATPKPECSGGNSYCRTKFSINDGVAVRVDRDCINDKFDHDVFTNSTPPSSQCETSFNDYDSETATTTYCYSSCTTDNCNTVTDDSLLPCKSDCSGNGNCNYLTGECICNAGYSGSSCASTDPATAPKAQRSCVQCNSLTDSDCLGSTTAVACPSSQKYCSSSTTTIYDESGNVARTVYARGCTYSNIAGEECSFTNIYSDSGISGTPPGYKEFTCFSTCDTDGCNTNVADGFIKDGEKTVLQCLQCNVTTGSCRGRGRSPCPSTSTYCKSTVTYMISKRDDRHYEDEPEYTMVRDIRECATEPVATQCTSKQINNQNLDMVTCTETCQTDGCNTGWPARPKCTQCSSPVITAGYDNCFQNPDDPEDCDFPYEEFCIIREKGIEKGSLKTLQGYHHEITRGCSHVSIGNGCSTTTPRSTDIESCNRTCTTDGCNQGNGSVMPLQTVAALILPTAIAWFHQKYF